MEPSDRREEPAEQPPVRRPPRRRAGTTGAPRKNGLVRINHALEPALRAAAQWRAAAGELERLDRNHQRRRAAILARQQRASQQLATFMSHTGANRRWLTDLLNLPDHATATTSEVHHDNP